MSSLRQQACVTTSVFLHDFWASKPRPSYLLGKHCAKPREDAASEGPVDMERILVEMTTLWSPCAQVMGLAIQPAAVYK